MNLGFGNLAQNRAFTLAEVLITLGIIGIVAAMTLPALITRNQNKALEASLKKNQTFILQAFEMYQAQNGERLRANEVNIGCAKLGLCLHDKIIPYFKILKDCKYGSSEKACISYFGNDTVGDKRNSNKYKTYSGKPLQKLNLLDDGQFILQDGSLILMENLGEEGRDVLISVDVNVLNKNPNRWGADLFTFQLMNDGRILPMGAPDTTYTEKETYCSATSTHEHNGIGCTYYALTEKNYFNELPR